MAPDATISQLSLVNIGVARLTRRFCPGKDESAVTAATINTLVNADEVETCGHVVELCIGPHAPGVGGMAGRARDPDRSMRRGLRHSCHHGTYEHKHQTCRSHFFPP